MIITTTQQIEGVSIRAYLGIVSSEAVIGINLFRDMFASIRNIVGGRAAGYEKAIAKGRASVLLELQEQARACNADAIIGVQFDYENVGSGMILICIIGTAVQIT